MTAIKQGGSQAIYLYIEMQTYSGYSNNKIADVGNYFCWACTSLPISQ